MASLVAQVSESRVDPIPGDSLLVLAPGIEIPAVNPGYVLWLPDDRSVSGMVVFTRPRRANEPTDDFISYATENDLAVLYAHTHNRLEFLFDESSMDLLLGYIAEVCRLYDIPRDRLLYCGMS